MALPSSSNVTDALAFYDPTLFGLLVGSLQYVTITQSEIAFAVSYVCQSMRSLTNLDYVAVKHILRYLQGSR